MSEMNCEQAQPLLSAYGDGELDLQTTLALERHVESCATCKPLLEQQRVLSKAVRGLNYHRAPDILRARLKAQLPAGPAAAPAAAPPPRRRRDLARWSLPIAAGLALAVGLNFSLATRRADESLRQELIAGHVRSLQAEHLNDVASSDQHTVKPWFAGKIDYSPPVRDLGAQDYPLIGGRLDYIAHREVAALVYHHRKHAINLYVWPAKDGDEAPREQAREGYSLVHWCREGMEYWAVSDLNAEELKEFAELQIAAVGDKAANAPNT